MSEEEIIKTIKDIADNSIEYDWLSWNEIDCIKGLLDLYQKEKEKNKELKEELDRQINTREIEEKFIDDNFISKDKIREKQMYYEKMLKEEKWGEKTELGFRNRIVTLQELLEEE